MKLPQKYNFSVLYSYRVTYFNTFTPGGGHKIFDCPIGGHVKV